MENSEVRLGFRPDDSFRSLINILRNDEETPLEKINEEEVKKIRSAPQNMQTEKEPEVPVEEVDSLENYDKEDFNQPGKKVKSKTPPEASVKEEPENKQQMLRDSKQEGDLYLCNHCFKTFRSKTAECTECYSNIVERIVKEDSKEDYYLEDKIERIYHKARSEGKSREESVQLAAKASAGSADASEVRKLLNVRGVKDFVKEIPKVDKETGKVEEEFGVDRFIRSRGDRLPSDGIITRLAKEDPEIVQLGSSVEWDYSFRYSHNQIGGNPLEDKKGNPVIWHTNPHILGGKHIRVFTDYQENWAKNQGAVPVREVPPQNELAENPGETEIPTVESKLSEAGEDIAALRTRRLEIEQQMLEAEKEYMVEQNRMGAEVDAINQQLKAVGEGPEEIRKDEEF